MSTYYNEIEPYPAQWIRNLIKQGLLPDGEVDERSILDVQPDELRGFTQCHFFAGIGGWPYALRLAGWPDDRPVWTGSCPCQPFSAAGHRGGVNDPRHLWPTFFGLIRERRPSVVFGEQVASKDGLGWLDPVHTDMESANYAFGALDLCAAGIGAPHIRQRLWFVGERLADTAHERHERGGAARRWRDGSPHDGAAGWLADADGWDASAERQQRGGQQRQQPEDGGAMCNEQPGPTNGIWQDADWLLCRDDRWRPVEAGTFPLAYGVQNRMGRLRAYGNAIVPQVAAEIIKAFMDVRP